MKVYNVPEKTTKQKFGFSKISIEASRINEPGLKPAALFGPPKFSEKSDFENTVMNL